MNNFGALFKKYRLKAEFASLTEFADAFALKGYIYESSIFSHWQKGTRVPSSRGVLLAMIEIFIEYGGITTLDQANELMESAGHGYLTNKEQQRIMNKFTTTQISNVSV